MLADTHCHLNFEAFDSDRSEVIARARDVGIKHMLNPGIDLKSSQAAIELADAYPEVFAAVGVHPNDSLTWDDLSLDKLRELAKLPKVVAIGEIGLDYYRDRAPREVQKHVFRQQLSLAAEMSLPVVIHTRNANTQDRQAVSDVLDILEEWQAELAASGSGLAERPGVLHSYSADEIAAQQATAINFWIGVTGPVTFRNAVELQSVVASLPLERMLIETDAPFLTPQPHRGQRNEPAYVRLVAEKIAQIHHLPFDQVAGATTASAERLFNW